MSCAAESTRHSSICANQPAALALLHLRQQLFEHAAHVAHDTHVGGHVLADLGRVDVHVDHVGILRVGREIARDPVVKPHAQRDQQVRVVDCLVDERFAVHAHHPQVQRVRLGHRADAEQRGRNGNLAFFGEGEQLVVSAREDDAVAGEDDGPLGRVDQCGSPAHLVCQPAVFQAVAGQTQLDRVVVIFGRLELHVLADVHQHRARPPRAGDVERLFQRGRQFLHVLDQVVVLRDGQRDAGDVRLLERIRADERRGDLPGDRDEGDRIHHRACQPRDEVRRARPGSGHADANAAGRPGVAVGCERCVFLVPDEDVVHGVVEQRVVGGHNRAAGIPEEHVDALSDKTLPDDLGASALHGITSTKISANKKALTE